MQKESLIQSSRRRGPDVWEYRWRESCPGDKRKHRRIVIGSLGTLRDKAAALKATAALRREKPPRTWNKDGHSDGKCVPFCAYEFSVQQLQIVDSKLASPTGFEPVLPP